MNELWVSNKSDYPGHCRPQDQNLEALFNNSAKNCFKLGTVQNDVNKASLIQERETYHANLKEELLITNSQWRKPTTHQEISKNSLLFFHGNLGKMDSFLWEIEGKREFPSPSQETVRKVSVSPKSQRKNMWKFHHFLQCYSPIPATICHEIKVLLV